MATSRRLSRVFDRITLYLPVLLMGLLALGTYWLVRSNPAPQAPAPAAPLTHDADYFMRNFTVRSFDATGLLKTELKGVEMRHFPDTDTLEIDQLQLRSYDDQGHLTTATAKRGLSNGDGSEVQLFGDAVVVRHESVDAGGKPVPRLELRSEFLHAISDLERVRTDKPVVIRRGEDQFSGDAMDYDNLNRQMNLQGQVRGMLVPTPASPASLKRR